MKRKTILLYLLSLFFLVPAVILAQDVNPAPTLVPPTLVPAAPDPMLDALLSESYVARIQRDGRVRVGMLLNEPPYGELNIRGEVVGYDAALARELAALWEVELDIVQVTRQNAFDMLRQARVDMLIAAQVHRRDLDGIVEFSQSYRLGRQALMLRIDDGAESMVNMANRKIAYVLGTEGEVALNEYLANSSLPVERLPYLTLDQAYVALISGEVDGVVGRQERLLRVAGEQLASIKLLPEAIAPEPFAIALPRQDLPLRNLVNRSLQFLVSNGRLPELHAEYFPGEDFPFDALPPWENIGEAPRPGDFDPAITYPQQYVTPRLLNERVLRVAGISTDPQSLSEMDRRLQDYQRLLLDQFANRWGVRLEFVQGDPIQLLNSGQADMAMGVTPNWSLASQVDFSLPIYLRGDRLMIPTNSRITGFSGLRNEIVAVISDDGNGAERAQATADRLGVRIRLFTTTQRDATSTLLESNNANVVFADSLRLLPHLEANPTLLKISPEWFSRSYGAIALPRNDIDFRLLVDYTLQEIAREGLLQSLLTRVIPPESDPFAFDYWPGPRQYLGFTLGS